MPAVQYLYRLPACQRRKAGVGQTDKKHDAYTQGKPFEIPRRIIVGIDEGPHSLYAVRPFTVFRTGHASGVWSSAPSDGHRAGSNPSTGVLSVCAMATMERRSGFGSLPASIRRYSSSDTFDFRNNSSTVMFLASRACRICLPVIRRHSLHVSSLLVIMSGYVCVFMPLKCVSGIPSTSLNGQILLGRGMWETVDPVSLVKNIEKRLLRRRVCRKHL